MDWTDEEEDALLAYLRDKKNNHRFCKRNAERESAFKDCAISLSGLSTGRRHFQAEDVKAFCTYLVEERYRLNSSSISHLFRIGLFEKKNGEPCDIYTRKECRKFAELDEAREDGRLSAEEEPDEATALPVSISESVTRRGARYKSTSSEKKDGKKSSITPRKRQKSMHPISVDDAGLLPAPQKHDSMPTLPEGSTHLLYKHLHLDGAQIGRKFTELENCAMIAADNVLSGASSKIGLNRPHRYGKDDLRLLKSILTTSVIQCWDSDAQFQTARALIGSCVFQWVFQDDFAETDMHGYPSREAAEAVWSIKFGQYDTGMLNPLYSILKDAYFWQTTQTRFLDVWLPKRAQELSNRLSSLIGTLFKIDLPRCSIEHEREQARLKDCHSWTCQVEALFLEALELCVKLRQSDHKTIFQWPAIGDKFNKTLMQPEGEIGANPQSGLVVKATFMPAVIDQRDSEDPSAVDGGVWYRAVVCLASVAEMEQVTGSTFASNQEDFI